MKKIISLISIVFVVALASVAYAADSEGPTVSTVSPLAATYEVPQMYYVTASDPSGVASCNLVVSSLYETPMSYNSDLEMWEVEYTFGTDRSANSIRGVCTDTLGNETTGKGRIMSVTETPMETTDGDADDTDPGASEVDSTGWSEGDLIAASPVLIKTVCPGGEDFTHTCRTVYFLDNEGKRHAFPNERVYFTWYENYNNMHLITDSMMASFTLGPNVTYHPGTKMVKFPTLNKVYTVSQYSVLRPIASEAVAIALYGDNWNAQIDDISEVFFGNYSVGEAVDDAVDFDVNAQSNSVQSINDNFSQVSGGQW